MKRSCVLWFLSAACACMLTGNPALAATRTPDVARELSDDQPDGWIYNGTREAIDAELPAFFGAARGDYISTIAHEGGEGSPGIGTNSPKLLDQFRFIFWQGPGPRVYFKDGFRMLVAFQAHNALTQVMAITSGDSNRLVATAFSNMACPTPRRDPLVDCQGWVVAIVYPAGTAPNPSLTREIIDWIERPSDNSRNQPLQQTTKYRVVQRALPND